MNNLIVSPMMIELLKESIHFDDLILRTYLYFEQLSKEEHLTTNPNLEFRYLAPNNLIYFTNINDERTRLLIR